MRVSPDISRRNLASVGGLIVPLYHVVAHRNAPLWVQSISFRTSGKDPVVRLGHVSFHCKQTGRFVSSVLTVFVTATHCISTAYKSLLFQLVARKGRKSNSYANAIAYPHLERTYRGC